MANIIQPVAALRHIGPCADIGQALGQRVNVPIRAVNALDLPRKPVAFDTTMLVDVVEKLRDQPACSP